MLAGVHPFIKPDAMATASSILQEEPAPLALHREGISLLVQYIVRKMLAKELAKRYQLVKEIHTDLVAQQDSGTATAPSEILSRNRQPAAEFLTRKVAQRFWIVAILLTAMLASFAGWSLKPSEHFPVTRVSQVLSNGQSFGGPGYPMVAVSPRRCDDCLHRG